MNFSQSSHKARWLFSREQLEGIRKKRRTAVKENAKEEGSKETPKLTEEDEITIFRYYQQRINTICSSLQLPQKVQAAAIIYFKRFYLHHTFMEQDPLRMCPVCIYVAGKVEESYISAETLCKAVGLKLEFVLRGEFILVKGLSFDLITHSPYRALSGLLMDIEDARAACNTELDAQLLSATPAVVATLTSSARQACDALMLTDVPLIFPPGLMALAALRSGAKNAGVTITKFLERAAKMAGEFAPSKKGAGTYTLTALTAALAQIDNVMVNAGPLTVNQQVAEAADRRFRMAMSAAAGATDGETSKEAKRDAKVKGRSQKQGQQDSKPT